MTIAGQSRLKALTVGVALMFPVIGSAQQPATTKPADPNASVTAMRDNWKQTIAYITTAAEELSEADYAYRPVATVRTFGELFGHVAGTQNLICAAVLGDPQPPEDAVEKAAKTKAALVKALKESTAYCARAYAIPATSGGAPIQLFGDNSTRFGALALNVMHDGEHYGNIVTYMRMKGLVPPSSRR
ncbi:MAG: DinB family protein [Gemmatimonadaceae bacterium]|nr:DinB family protein [Gemmatimonadaceae bacterium]